MNENNSAQSYHGDNVAKEKQIDRSRKNLSLIMEENREQLARAKEQGIMIAWMTAVAPAELCVAMDILPAFPENYGPLLASRGLSKELCDAAVAGGYSEDLCSYALANLGSILLKKGVEGTEGLPRPDLLIATQYGCTTHVKWWEEMARIFDVPLFILDSAVTLEEDLLPYQEQYFASEIKDCIQFLEENTGKGMDYDKLSEVVKLSGEAGRLWEETLKLRMNRPCPMGPIEVYTHMGVAVTLCGSQTAVGHYRLLYEDVSKRVSQGKGVVQNERFRLIWDFFPLWYNLRLFRKFEEYGGVFVADVYGNAFSGNMEGTDPIKSLVNRYFWEETPPRTGSTGRAEEYCKLIEDYAVDGFVFHSNRSCRFFSPRQLDMKRIIDERFGIPTLVFEGDMTNPNLYSEKDMESRIDAFFEVLETRRIQG